jgi:predicted DNA-binding transcriptional regulator AlpA
MTPHEAERRARQAEASNPAEDRAISLARILSLPEWYALCGFSDATGRRILKSGKGPKVIQLSERRKGIALGDHLAWIDSNASATA